MATSKSPDRESGWVVELDIYAGRENPAWPIAPDLVKLILDRWEELPAWLGEAPAPPVLGYRGVYIRSHVEGEVWYVFRNIVSRSSNDTIERRKDADRALEKRLIESAPAGLLPRLDIW